MPTEHLIIRNLTSTPLELKLVERYITPEITPRYAGFLTNWTTSARNGTQPSSVRFAEQSQTFVKQEVDLSVEPFKTLITEVKAQERQPSEKLRLTFHVGDERHRIDIPSPKPESQTLVPLTPNSTFELTGVFHHEHSHLTIYSSAKLQSWMGSLKDATPLSACSIPGTHNAPACYRALPSVRCQSVTPRAQLDNGVRFFDIRVQLDGPASPRLALIHSVFPVSLTGPKFFHDLLTDVFAFLDKNPSETLIMSLKREGVGSYSDQDLGRILRNHYTTGKDARRWYTDPAVPTLAQVRGKIVLMRRFAIDDDMRTLNSGRGWATDGMSTPLHHPLGRTN